jgi:hypothetical protein
VLAAATAVVTFAILSSPVVDARIGDTPNQAATAAETQ